MEKLPAGTEFVFDLGIKLIERQFDRLDRIDAKVGILWTLLGAVTLWLFKALAAEELSFLTGATLYTFIGSMVLFVAGFILAFLALLPRSYSFPVNYSEIVNRGDEEANVIKYKFVEGILTAYRGNLL